MTTDAVPGVADPAEGLAVPEPSAPSNVYTLPDGNTVTLYPKTPLALGIAARAAVRNKIISLTRSGHLIGSSEDIEGAIIEGVIAEIYLRLGIASWTFFTADHKPETINPESITRLLPYSGGGRDLAELADTLYSREVFPPSPLAQETSQSLPDMPTANSMSLKNDTGMKPRMHSGRSSRNGTGGKRSGVRGR